MRRRGRVILRKWLRRGLRIHDTPHSIAMGVSIGTFLGWGPLYGAHTILALAVAALARCNKAAAVLACWVNNPVTMVPLLYLQYLLGSLTIFGNASGGGWKTIVKLKDSLAQVSLFRFGESMHHLGDSVRAGWEVFWPWLVGSLISSTVLAALAYPVAKRAVIRHRHRAELRRAERHCRLQALREGPRGEDPA
jgi:uncharacterized protein